MASPQVNSTHVLLDAVDNSNSVAGNDAQVRGAASPFTVYSNEDFTGYGWSPADAAIRTDNLAGATLPTELMGTCLADGNDIEQSSGSVIDGSSAAGDGKRLFYSHHYTSQGESLTNTDVTALGTGYMVGLVSLNSPVDMTLAARLWSQGGQDVIPTLFQPHPGTFIAMDAEHAASEVDTGLGTEMETLNNSEFDATQITNVIWAHKASSANTQFYQTISRFGYFDAYTLFAGDVNDPCGFQQLLDIAYSEKHFAMAVGGVGQFRPRMAIEFGHADLGDTETTYFRAANQSISFEEAIQDKTSTLIRVLHAPENKIGMELKLRSGDTWLSENCTYASATAWHLRFASDVGASVDFTNCIVLNAGGTSDDCELGGDVTFDGGLLSGCGKLSVNGATISSAVIADPLSTHAVSITEQSTLTNVNFVNSGDPEIVGIEIPDPVGGTVDYTLEGVTFTGFEFPLEVLGATGTVNISITGGGDVPEVKSGTENRETPTLLGTGWADGVSYAVPSGGGDNKRAVIVVISNDGNKVPDNVTFGGSLMQEIQTSVNDPIGLSMWSLVETGAESVFDGSSQSIIPSWSDGAPTNITIQTATYDHIHQANVLPATTARDEDGLLSRQEVAILDAISALQTTATSVSFPISAGSDRALVVLWGTEDNSANDAPEATAVSYGGQPLVKAVETILQGRNSASIWYLDEAGIAAAVGDTVSVSTIADDGPRYRIMSLENVDQDNLVRDAGVSDVGGTGIQDYDVSPLAVQTGDFALATFVGTSGDDVATWGGLVSNSDQLHADLTADDPFQSAAATYLGLDSVSQSILANIGEPGSNRLGTVAVIFSAATSGSRTPKTLTVQGGDEGLVITAAQTRDTAGPWGISFSGDVTERDEVSRADERVAVADFVKTGGSGVVTSTLSDTNANGTSQAQIISAAFRPFVFFTGGPTVNVLSSVSLTLTDLQPGSEVRAYVGSDLATATEIDGIENSGTSFSLDHSEGGNDGFIVVHSLGFENLRIDLTYSSNDQTIPIQQRVDRQYLNP